MSEPSHDKSESHGSHKKGGHGGAHGGSHEEGHEGAPEWLISFADNVALMMGFFVILLAMNMAKSSMGGGGSKGEHGEVPKEEQMLDFALSVREAFNNPVDINSTDPHEQALVKRLMQRAGKSETRDPGTKGHEQDVKSLNRNDYFAVSGSVTFAEDSVELTEPAKAAVREVAGKAKGLRLVLEVRGHTSSVEALHGPEAAMKLSSDRAMAVAHMLAQEGIDWWQMRLVTCGDHDRLAAFPANRAADKANARVEIILTDQVVPDQVPTRYSNQPAGPAPGASAKQPGA